MRLGESAKQYAPMPSTEPKMVTLLRLVQCEKGVGADEGDRGACAVKGSHDIDVDGVGAIRKGVEADVGDRVWYCERDEEGTPTK